VVIPLFLVAVTALILPFVWPSRSADELFASAQPLLASENPDDWDVAFEKYLDPLARKYPDQYKEEIAAARMRVLDRRELRRAITDGTKADPRTEAQRGYLLGLRLAQAGDADAARRTWTAVATAFGSVESERRWVDLSRAGLESLNQPINRMQHVQFDRAPVLRALEYAKALAAAGKHAEAKAVFDALTTLTDRDPALRKMIEEARGK
jgi:hypothetical protein